MNFRKLAVWAVSRLSPLLLTIGTEDIMSIDFDRRRYEWDRQTELGIRCFRFCSFHPCFDRPCLGRPYKDSNCGLAPENACMRSRQAFTIRMKPFAVERAHSLYKWKDPRPRIV
jgi:hypothetical protein